MKHKLFSLAMLALSCWLMYSCQNNKTRVTQINNGVELNAQNINIRLQFYADNIVRVTKWAPNGKPQKLSLSVIDTIKKNVDITVVQNSGNIEVKTAAINLIIDKKTANIVYSQCCGKTLLAEQGQPLFKQVVYSGDTGFSVQQNFKLTPHEGIYGLGQHQYGYFNYRGKQVKLVQTNTDAVNPFLVSTNNYGILWDNYSMTIFNDDKNGASIWSDMGDNIDYYFVQGANIDSIISGYRTLTGKAPMYSKSAYGYWQSREKYKNQGELMAAAETYRKLKIPIDNMIQDWDYWNGRENWSGMFFDKTLFPDPKGMCDRLHQLNFKIIISIWPALGPNTAIYADMQKNGFLYEPVGWAGFKYYDAFNKAATKLYWSYLKNGLYSQGLDGWWIDSTEPDVVNALTKESTEYEMKKVGRCHIGSWARYLNAFSLVMTDELHKYWRNETTNRRSYILTRSTFAGQQRNGATTWSGDIGASWQVYRNQISAGINHSMSGIPYWTFDIGAFVLGAYEGVFCNGGKDPAYQELYNRMFQLGAFTPIFRSHGSETPREIWEMGEFTESLKKFDNLRYRLMPYIYSLAWQVTNNNYTIMRGLPMDFNNDTNTYNIDNQFMFGPALMACPVTEYMYHTPPQPSELVTSAFFKTNSGQPGLDAFYYKDAAYKVLGKQTIDTSINVFWYTGRPDYVTDSMFSIRWQGKLVPNQTGKHQFHMKSFDAKRIIINGDTLKIVYSSVEQYTESVELQAGKEYDFVLETENTSTGAARMILFWKTPGIFAAEAVKAEREKNRDVYLPQGTKWIDFWTGENYEGGQKLSFDAPKDIMPLLVKAGSIVPMGPFIEYATQKPANPLELRVYAGANGKFTLYEDENDNYNYEKGFYSTIDFIWNDSARVLTICQRKGEFAGMLMSRTINIVLVNKCVGTGVELSEPAKTIIYNGSAIDISF